MSHRAIAAICILAVASGCAIQTPPARLSPEPAPTEREVEAAERLADPTCSGAWSWLYPGLGQICTGKTGEGAVLASLATAEIGLAVALARADVDADQTGDYLAPESLPLVGLQNLWVYSLSAVAIDDDLARRHRYTPQETLGELVAAPFNVEVLSEPSVWAGILALFGGAVAYSALLDSGDGSGRVRNPMALRMQLPAPVRWGGAGATGVVLFEHVAIGEEMLFRGLIQSAIARQEGPWAGWAWGSLIFGTVHLPNAAALPADERTDYLAYSVPFITVVGSYLGLAYMWNDYRLGPPVALHFWYDLLLSAASYAADPESSPIGASVTVPF